MKGISIFRKNKYQEYHTDFLTNFNSILNKIDKYYWFIPKMVFSLPFSWNYGEYITEKDIYNSQEWNQFNDVFIDRDKERSFSNMLLKPAFLTEYSKYFVDDWCDIYGFDEINLNLFLNSKSRDLDFIKSLLKKGIIKICFSNIDGAYWDFFTAENELFDFLMDILSKDKGCELRIPYFDINKEINES